MKDRKFYENKYIENENKNELSVEDMVGYYLVFGREKPIKEFYNSIKSQERESIYSKDFEIKEYWINILNILEQIVIQEAISNKVLIQNIEHKLNRKLDFYNKMLSIIDKEYNKLIIKRQILKPIINIEYKNQKEIFDEVLLDIGLCNRANLNTELFKTKKNIKKLLDKKRKVDLKIKNLKRIFNKYNSINWNNKNIMSEEYEFLKNIFIYINEF